VATEMKSTRNGNAAVGRLTAMVIRTGALLFACTTGATFITLTAPAAYASTGGATMPWDTPLQNLLDNLTGPTARALVIIAIVVCGLLWAFTRNEEGLKKLGQIAFGGAIAMGAVAMLASLGFTGALL
jgi:type IV secretory pathway VirB2 component (pilin)